MRGGGKVRKAQDLAIASRLPGSVAGRQLVSVGPCQQVSQLGPLPVPPLQLLTQNILPGKQDTV